MGSINPNAIGSVVLYQGTGAGGGGGGEPAPSSDLVFDTNTPFSGYTDLDSPVTMTANTCAGVNASGGSVTFNLPTGPNGTRFAIKNYVSSTNSIVLHTGTNMDLEGIDGSVTAQNSDYTLPLTAYGYFEWQLFDAKYRFVRSNGAGGGGGAPAATRYPLALNAVAEGITPVTVGAIRLQTGAVLSGTALLGATSNAAHVVTVRMRRFSTGALVSGAVWSVTGNVAEDDLAAPVTIAATDWYLFEALMAAGGQTGIVYGLDLQAS